MPRRPPGRPVPRRTFGATWWGRAWIDALEQRARLDPNRLPRGRTYAHTSRVGVLTIEPGEVRTSVLGSRDSAYRVRLRVRAFSDAEWEVVLDAIAARAAHAAALLDGELSPGIVDDARDAGCDLLPGPGEVGTSCSCPDWANPCKHAAAVCYLMADRLDEDPFELLALRGRSRDQILAGLRRRRASPQDPRGRDDGTLRDDPGVVARDAYQAWARRQDGDEGDELPASRSEPREGDELAGWPELPRPPLPGPQPGRPAPLVTDAPAGVSATAASLAALAGDAAARAWELATGQGDGGLSLDGEADLARRSSAAIGSPGLAALAARSTLSERKLVRLARAWDHGGADAVAALDDSWSPPAEVIHHARQQLLGEVARVRVSGNRLSLPGGVQLRYSQGGRWYRFERRGGDWEITGPGDPEPLAAFDAWTR